MSSASIRLTKGRNDLRWFMSENAVGIDWCGTKAKAVTAGIGMYGVLLRSWTYRLLPLNF